MTTEQRQFARKLRQRATDPEDILWSLLRNRRLDGLKFRRQVPLLGYTVDFIVPCPSRPEFTSTAPQKRRGEPFSHVGEG